jgi:hypothetical protein
MGHFSRSLIGALIGIALEIPALLAAIGFAGAGHGTYWLAKILFPLTMASTAITGDISGPAIVAALVQFPIYGLIIAIGQTNAKCWRNAGMILLIHALLILVSFLIAGSGFS